MSEFNRSFERLESDLEGLSPRHEVFAGYPTTNDEIPAFAATLPAGQREAAMRAFEVAQLLSSGKTIDEITAHMQKGVNSPDSNT